MRELKRSIARAHMLDAGAKNINKTRSNGRSYFSVYWRFWFAYDPKDKERNKKNDNIIKKLMRALSVKKTVNAVAN